MNRFFRLLPAVYTSFGEVSLNTRDHSPFPILHAWIPHLHSITAFAGLFTVSCFQSLSPVGKNYTWLISLSVPAFTKLGTLVGMCGLEMNGHSTLICSFLLAASHHLDKDMELYSIFCNNL